MFKLLFSIFVGILISEQAFAKNAVHTNADFNFVEINGQLRLSMSPFFRKKIRAINPTFRFFKETQFSYSLRDKFRESDQRLPHVVIEDFNKDGKDDLAVLGYYANRPEYFQVVIFETDRLKGYTFRNVFNFHGAKQEMQLPGGEPGQIGLATYLVFFEKKVKNRKLASLKGKSRWRSRTQKFLGVETWGSMYGDYFLVKKRSVKRK